MSGVETAAAVTTVAGVAMAPATGGLSLLAIPLAGTGLTAYSQYQQGQYQKGVAQTNATIAAQNAEIARQEATQARHIGEYKVKQEGRRKRILIGKQRVAQAASGVTGRTADTLIADTERQSAIDVALIRYRSASDARSFLREGELFQTESARVLREGKYRAKAGKLKAGSTILSGAGAMGGQYVSYKQSGVF